MKPVILLVPDDCFNAAFGSRLFTQDQTIAAMVRENGGIPVTAGDIRYLDAYASLADALILLPGGVVHPARYGALIEDFAMIRKFSQTREDFDFGLFEKFLAAGKPILGIGRGAKVINAALGGTLAPGMEQKLSAIAETLTVTERDAAGEVMAFNHQSLPIRGLVSEDTAAIAGFTSELAAKGGTAVKDAGTMYLGLNGGSAQVWGEANGVRSAHRALAFNRGYPEAVGAGGACPVLIPVIDGFDEYAELLDGLVLTGTLYYTEEGLDADLTGKCENEERPVIDDALIDAFVKTDTPIFGICLGLQELNTYFGGTLKRYFKRERGVEHLLTDHDCITTGNSFIRPFFGETFRVNSRHEVCIDVLGEGLEVTGRSPDGIIEEMIYPGKEIYAVQYHPERMRGDHREPPASTDTTPLFAWFTEVCRQHQP